MIIVGARGFANEILEVLHQTNTISNIAFYDDVNTYPNNLLHEKFPVLNSEKEVKQYFQDKDNRFILGLGSPRLRRLMYDKFIALGGQVISTITDNATIGELGVQIGLGSNIFDHAILSTNVKLGKCSIVYYHAVLTHDVQIGEFVDVSPGATILGRSKIGNYCQIGSNATILPDVTIGNNVIVAAGAVVTENVPDNCMVAGMPAKVKKTLEPLAF